jgi:hypothetical protein
MKNRFHSYNKEKFVMEKQVIHHIITSLHTFSCIENNHNQLFIVNCDKYYELINENNNLNQSKLTDWLIINIG